jgi:hypothetical protein
MATQRITFTLEHEQFGAFTDAVEVPLGATDEQIETAKSERFVAWVQFLMNPPPPPPAEDVIDG